MGTKKLRNPALYTRPTYRDLLARLAANTRRLREARGWTQAEAAEHCDMAVYVLQTVESGRANFTGTVVARLCEGFEVDVRELFGPAAPLAKRNRGRPRKDASTTNGIEKIGGTPDGEEGGLSDNPSPEQVLSSKADEQAGRSERFVANSEVVDGERPQTQEE